MATSFAARPGTPVPPWVVALLAPGDAPLAAETRVRGLDAGARVDDRGAGGESRGRRWANAASYDRKASGSTQFLSRDPAASMTGEPYAYARDNPLNATDPTGMCPFLVPQSVCDAAGALGGAIGRAAGAVGNAAGAAAGAVGNQVVSWAGDIHNGGLPGGNCIVLIQNNCQENLVGNVHTVENSPAGPLFRADAFLSDAFDFAKSRAGESVSPLQVGLDVVGTGLVFSPAQLAGSIPARIAGPLADNWALAANLWNNRAWIGLGLGVVRGYAMDAFRSCGP